MLIQQRRCLLPALLSSPDSVKRLDMIHYRRDQPKADKWYLPLSLMFFSLTLSSNFVFLSLHAFLLFDQLNWLQPIGGVRTPFYGSYLTNDELVLNVVKEAVAALRPS